MKRWVDAVCLPIFFMLYSTLFCFFCIFFKKNSICLYLNIIILTFEGVIKNLV